MDHDEVLDDAEVGVLGVAGMKCDCGSEEFIMRNYSQMWHDGDIHCAECNKFQRRFDAG